jgi:hypothetical protein
VARAARAAYNLAMPEGAPESARVRAAGWLAMLALLAGVGLALHASFDALVQPPNSDVDYYLRYMRAVAERGLGAFPELFRAYLAQREDWVYPNPTRLAFITTSALWSKVFGATPRALAELSLAAHLALIALVWATSVRWFGSLRAFLGVALVACSALLLGLARQALSDGFATLTQVASVCLFLEYVRRPTRTRAVLAGSAFGLALLSKELALLLALPLLAHAALERRRSPDGPSLLSSGLVLALPAALGAGLLWLAAGGLSPLLGVLRIVLTSPATNEYAKVFGSGGWFRYPIDELLMSPWPTLCGLAGVVAALLAWRRGSYQGVPVALALVYVLQVTALASFTKNLRYVAVLEVPLRLLAVGLLWEFFAAGRRRLGRAACTLAVVLLCTSGWRDYRHVWLVWRTYDPMTTVLAGVRGLIPLDPHLTTVPDGR